MVVEIILKSGNSYYTSEYDTFGDLREAISTDASVECWWYLNNGRAYVERFVFNMEDIQVMRTDANAVQPTPDIMMGKLLG